MELRNRILNGDTNAAESFFEAHIDALYEFVSYRVGSDRATTEDIVQDTLLVAVERMAAFDGRSALFTWLCGIAKNKIRSQRRKRRPVPLADVLVESDQEIHAILESVESEEVPQWILEQQETRDLVGATLSSLPPGYRSALQRRYVDEMSIPEISRLTGKGRKATESTLYRARVAFARILEHLARRRGGGEER